MNMQEQEQLNSFLHQLVQAQATNKQADAEQMIREACSKQPDAHYLLVQRCLLLDQALQHAQTEISRLKTPDSQQQSAGKFLDASSWGNSAVPRAPLPSATPYAALAPAPAPVAASSWGAGLLGTVASTAAGVVAGSFLFQGIEHLMGNHDSHRGFLSDSSETLPPASTHNTMTDSLIGPMAASNDFSADTSGDADDPDWL